MVRQQPEQQAPPVQRLRVQYAKRGRARFLSSRDFGRAFERALRRAEVPMAYSSGFTPHPRISYANAAPTSAASEAEFLEIGLAERCDPDKVRVALDAALPDGLDIVRVVEARGESLADQLTASEWLVDLGPVDADALGAAIESLLAADEATTTRMTKSGPRTFDVRGAIERLEVSGPNELAMVLRHLVPLVRPDDVVAVLRRLDARLATDRPVLLTRTSQGRLLDGRIEHPFD
ncbi:MAG TPA: TIGR03936 family radical SAM-associated protein [Propionibacteriaceae bacterium]|nr:TIGR03936 family radical SAM-associated protein [Propionibacteriaceae bacterium]